MKATIAIVSVFMCLRFVNSEEQRTLTVDDYFSIPELSSPQISPDGKWVVYVAMQQDPKKNTRNRDLWKVSSDGGGPIQLTNHPQSDSSPKWRPKKK